MHTDVILDETFILSLKRVVLMWELAASIDVYTVEQYTTVIPENRATSGSEDCTPETKPSYFALTSVPTYLKSYDPTMSSGCDIIVYNNILLE